MASDSDPSTSPSVLGRVRDRHDHRAWAIFDATYRPLIAGQCVREGLNSTDAEEVTQRVLVKLVQKLQAFEYDRRKGRFRDWLDRVTHNTIIDFLRCRPPDAGTGDTGVQKLLENIPSPEDLSAESREAFETLLNKVTERVRTRVGDARWRIFEAMCQGSSAQELHGATRIPIARIYKYCSEVRGLLRDEADELLGRECTKR